MRRALVVVVALAALAPPARAAHLGGDGAFDPVFTFAPERHAPDSLTGVEMRVNLPDGHAPLVSARYVLPARWRFAVASIRPGTKADGSPAETCAQVQHATYGDADHRAPALEAPRAEPLSVNEFLTVATTRSRETTAAFVAPDAHAQAGPHSYPNTRTMVFGRSSVGDLQGGRLVFLRWDAATETATLCQYLHRRDGRLDRETTPGLYDRSAREHLLPVTLRRLPDRRWEAAVDYSPMWDRPYLRAQEMTIVQHDLELPIVTGGAWQANCGNQLCPATDDIERDRIKRAQVPFSRTPVEPGSYEVRASFTTCALAAPSGCEPGSLRTVERVRTIVVGHEDPAVHTYARLAATATPHEWYYVSTGPVFRAEWAPPPFRPEGHRVRGYVLTIAPPNQPHLAASRLLVADPSAPGFEPRDAPCGPDGASLECAHDLVFPISAPGGTLHGDGKYAISLITVWDDGHRTDGRCDDGTAAGAPCEPDRANFAVEPGFRGFPAGIDFRELLVRSEDWPLTYAETVSQPNGAGNPSINTPVRVLFADLDARRAELVTWNWNGPATASLFGSGTGIAGSNARAQGTVVFTSTVSAGPGSAVAIAVAGAFARGAVLAYGTAPSVTPFAGVRIS